MQCVLDTLQCVCLIVMENIITAYEKVKSRNTRLMEIGIVHLLFRLFDKYFAGY